MGGAMHPGWSALLCGPQHPVNHLGGSTPSDHPCVFPHDYRDLNDLMNINIAVDTNPTVRPDPHNRTLDPAPEQEPDEPRMIGDFDGSASDFWKLYCDEAKSHDDARI